MLGVMVVVPSVIDKATILGLMYRIFDIIIIIIIRFFGLYTPMLVGQIECNRIGSNWVPVVPSVIDSVTILGMVLVLVILICFVTMNLLFSSTLCFVLYQGFASFHQLLFWPDFYLVGQFLQWSMYHCVKIWMDEQALIYLMLLVSLSHHLGYDSILLFVIFLGLV